MSGFCSFLFTISSIYKLIYCRWWKDTMDSGDYSGYNILTWQRKQSRPRKQLTRSQREDDRDTLLRKAKFRKRVFSSISQLKTKWSSVHKKRSSVHQKKVFGASARLIDILSTVCAYTILQSVLLWLDKRTKSKKQNNPKIVHNQIEFL